MKKTTRYTPNLFSSPKACTLTKIIGKLGKNIRKMGELFAYFDKNILILRKTERKKDCCQWTFFYYVGLSKISIKQNQSKLWYRG